MARFAGKVGFATQVLTAPGVWGETITERQYYGDVERTSRKLTDGESINDDISVEMSISIVADAFANENFFAIRYVVWRGALWKVPTVEVQAPRLKLRMGGVYNGPTLTPSG